MMYILCESVCDWSADWLVSPFELSFDFENNIQIVKNTDIRLTRLEV